METRSPSCFSSSNSSIHIPDVQLTYQLNETITTQGLSSHFCLVLAFSASTGVPDDSGTAMVISERRQQPFAPQGRIFYNFATNLNTLFFGPLPTSSLVGYKIVLRSRRCYFLQVLRNITQLLFHFPTAGAIASVQSHLFLSRQPPFGRLPDI